MSNCTWRNCKNYGKHEWFNRQGSPWCLLCDEHNRKLKEACDAESKDWKASRMLGAWAKARSGHGKHQQKG